MTQIHRAANVEKEKYVPWKVDSVPGLRHGRGRKQDKKEKKKKQDESSRH